MILTQLKLSKLKVLLPVNGKMEDQEIDVYFNDRKEPVIHEQLVNEFFLNCKKPSEIKLILDL